MAEDMEMFLEQVIKKTNPEEYIKILEQDREDFAEEINRLNNIIDELEKWLESEIDRITRLKNPKKGIKPYGEENYYYENMILRYKEVYNKLKELKGDNK